MGKCYLKAMAARDLSVTRLIITKQAAQLRRASILYMWVLYDDTVRR